MKKIVSLVLCLTMLMCMCTVAGCGKTQKSKGNLTGKEIAQQYEITLLYSENLESAEETIGNSAIDFLIHSIFEFNFEISFKSVKSSSKINTSHSLALT